MHAHTILHTSRNGDIVHVPMYTAVLGGQQLLVGALMAV